MASIIPKTMKGVQLVGHGGPEMLHYSTTLPVPKPREKEVLIQVSAAGVNNTDINTRVGWYSKKKKKKKKNDTTSTCTAAAKDDDDATWSGTALGFPRIQGADVCGTIVAVGDQLLPDRIGERVSIEPCLCEENGQALPDDATAWYFGSECDGGFAEYTVVSARHAHAISSDCPLTDIELASFPCSYSTAENMLTRSQVTQHDKVLVTGASGGVGSAVVQLAKARGAYVIAVTSTAKAQQLQDLGADEIVDRSQSLAESLGENSVNVVLDLVAGPSWPQLLQILKPKGRYAVSGAIGGPMVELDVRTLYLKDLSFFGCTVLEPQVFGNLVSRIVKGEIQPLVARTFPLQNVREAQDVFQLKQHVGKIVLQVT